MFLTDHSRTLWFDHSRTEHGRTTRPVGVTFFAEIGNMGEYSNKTAVITGGSTGIGLATAQRFIAGGGRVIVTGRNGDALAAAQRALGASAITLRSDTARLEDIDALAARVRAEFGEVDFVFVNAGVAVFAPLDAVTADFYDHLFSVNARGAFFTVQRLAPLVKRGGSFVLNTSIVDEMGMGTTSVYAATKAALRSYARTLATELLPAGVRVNAVSPGPIETPIYGKLGLNDAQRAGFEAQMREQNPMRRFGASDEVAAAALFLAFGATYTTGAELPVDGGLSQL
ncbi:MAG: SDR family oxidoreductase [Polyangiales bacterium]